MNSMDKITRNFIDSLGVYPPFSDIWMDFGGEWIENCGEKLVRGIDMVYTYLFVRANAIIKG